MKLTRTRTALFLILTIAVLVGMASKGHDGQSIEAAGLLLPDVSSVKSGNWSDPTLWSNGAVPSSGKSVAIDSGHIVVYDVLSGEVLGQVSIQGTLRFSRNTSTKLITSDNILVQAGGFLDMGTATDFIPKNVKAEVIWQLSQGQANSYKGGPNFEATDKGLWAMSGSRWEVSGAPLLRPWTKLVGNAPAGATTVVVENDVTDWHIGGAAVITQTSSPAIPFVDSLGRSTYKYDFENEIRTVTKVESLANGRSRITFNQPLNYLHEGTAPYRGEVGLLGRNVRFETLLEGVNESTLIADVGTRKFAHTMWMNGAKGDAQYGEFKFMGNYLKLGRYPIHTHKMGETSRGKVIRGNGIWYTGFRWVNNHSSYGVTVEDNVGFSSTQSGYFGEADSYQDPKFPGSNRYILDDVSKDLLFVHNLGVEATAVRFEDRSKGDFVRHSTFWVASSKGYAFLGNNAVGTRDGRDTGGFMVGEVSFNSPGTMGEHFLKNESHSNQANGFFHWNNRSEAFEIVDSLMWRNGGYGMHLGAYTGEFMNFNGKLHGNTRGGLLSNSIDTFVQDGLITDSPIGWMIGSYFAEQSPDEPHWNVRNSYKNLEVGYSHLHDACTSDSSERLVLTRECGADYSYLIGNEFKDVAIPIDFGWQANANSWHKVADSVGLNPALPTNFTINRKDQKVESNQGPESSAIVGSGNGSTNNADFDGLVTPIGTPWADYPPEITLAVSVSGKTAKLKATATDDKDIPKVEFFVDFVKVATKTAPPYEVSVDLSDHTRKYAYVYARALDKTVVFQHKVAAASNGQELLGPFQQRAYSDVTEIGPEVLLKSGGQVTSVLTSITVDRASATVLPGRSVQFSANGSDQQGNSFPVNPTWEVSGGGSINQSGLFTAGAVEGGPFTVFAANGAVSGSATVSVVSQSVGSQLMVSDLTVASGKSYRVLDGPSMGSPVYVDRNYVFTGIPVIIQGGIHIRTANDDKNRTEVPLISFSVNQNVRVYVGFDARATSLPSWLGYWANTGQTLGTSDVLLKLYVKDFAAGPISLGGNMATGSVGPSSNYTLIIVAQDTPINQAPEVDAGPAQSAKLTFPALVGLEGSVDDDGLPNPPATVSGQWSLLSGPEAGGTVEFVDSTNPVTFASFSDSGVYNLRLSANDGEFITTDDVVITVTERETLTSIAVGPTVATVLPGASVQFTVSGLDQHGDSFAIDPTWEVSGGGSINQSGLFTAGAVEGGPFTVFAANGAVSGSATVSVVSQSVGSQLMVSDLTVASGQSYRVADGLAVGDSYYIDRNYTYTSVPVTLQGNTYVRTANVDKGRTETSLLTFSVNQGVTVHVGYDSRATSLPAWLVGWSNTGSSLKSTDVALNLYAKDFAAGPITLGGNLATGAAGASSNYAVVLVPR